MEAKAKVLEFVAFESSYAKRKYKPPRKSKIRCRQWPEVVKENYSAATFACHGETQRHVVGQFR
jgi:hypothetical protein